MIKPQKSKMMAALYGEAASDIVYNRCQELSPDFNKLVQELVYDVFWARPGLTLKEKSLVTIISLIMHHKEEQLRIHLSGFFNLGGTPDMISQIIHYMANSQYIVSPDKALNILKELTETDVLSVNTITFSSRDKSIVDLSSCIALGDQDKTKHCMANLLNNKMLSREDVENILLHQIVYSGFPCTMNGFAILSIL